MPITHCIFVTKHDLAVPDNKATTFQSVRTVSNRFAVDLSGLDLCEYNLWRGHPNDSKGSSYAYKKSYMSNDLVNLRHRPVAEGMWIKGWNDAQTRHPNGVQDK